MVFSIKAALALLGLSCAAVAQTSADAVANETIKPIITSIFTADPSAHVFHGHLYVYPSHDRNNTIPDNEGGDHYDMVDYHVLSMESIDKTAKDNGVALKLEDVPWAAKQLWAPDAAFRDGKFFLFFPAKDHDGYFRIGVATSFSPVGPFVADPLPINGSFGTDPAVFVDDDGETYMYHGGGNPIQLVDNTTLANGPTVAVMSCDLHSFKAPPKPVVILDEKGSPLLMNDHDHRFFEASWMHKYRGKYYLSYSTGDTHYMVYAIGTSPFGPFTYTGRILDPVVGWTTHGSIVRYRNKWYLFYHDSSCSGGIDFLRCVKVREIFYDNDGKIHLTNPNPSPAQSMPHQGPH